MRTITIAIGLCAAALFVGPAYAQHHGGGHQGYQGQDRQHHQQVKPQIRHEARPPQDEMNRRMERSHPQVRTPEQNDNGRRQWHQDRSRRHFGSPGQGEHHERATPQRRDHRWNFRSEHPDWGRHYHSRHFGRNIWFGWFPEPQYYGDGVWYYGFYCLPNGVCVMLEERDMWILDNPDSRAAYDRLIFLMRLQGLRIEIEVPAIPCIRGLTC